MHSDWTDPAVYEHMRGYEADAFATEYLIRNADFVAECERLASGPLTTGEITGSRDFAARWGARFHDSGCRASLA
ncbi:transcriptional regulator domain-containing protein [Mesorhizobium sp. Cs1299R1N3]|uniref:transcriptional regulator domain-containing protein n=1 Tax=Mesorhizobium sp. Cs1299R1N3 TaxID=3015173 RepID=UPI00301C546D